MTRFFSVAKIILALMFSSALIDSNVSHARERRSNNQNVERDEQGRKVIYKQRNVVDFDAMLLEGDIRNPNEFYFVRKPEEKFGSLVKRRKNFHKEMLRDTVMVQ